MVKKGVVMPQSGVKKLLGITVQKPLFDDFPWVARVTWFDGVKFRQLAGFGDSGEEALSMLREDPEVAEFIRLRE